jgi:microcystin-dependent protein
MALTRAVTSAVDRFAARLAYISERVVNLERSSHRHNTPQTALQPVGSVQFWIGDTAPAGWVLMNGQTLTNAETIYPDLWAVVPAQFKSGSDIILPDCRGRVMVGRSSEAEFNQVGATGGAKTVALTIPQLPSHGHGAGNLQATDSGSLSMSGSASVSGDTGNAGAHTHQILTDIRGDHGHGLGGGVGIAFVTGFSPSAYGSTTPTLFGLRESAPWEVSGNGAGRHFHAGGTDDPGNHRHQFSGGGSASVSGAAHGHSISGSTANAGSGNAHQNLQPYLTLTPIIKIV